MERQVVKQRTSNLGGITGKGFMPGQSGNPSGRPKKEACLTSQFKDRLDEVPKVLPDGNPNDRELTWASIISERVVLEAAKGNPSIIKELLDRVEGKVKEQIDHSGEGFKLILGIKSEPEKPI